MPDKFLHIGLLQSSPVYQSFTAGNRKQGDEETLALVRVNVTIELNFDSLKLALTPPNFENRWTQDRRVLGPLESSRFPKIRILF